MKKEKWNRKSRGFTFLILLLLLITSNIYTKNIQSRLLNSETRKTALKELWDKKEAAIPELKSMLKSSSDDLKKTALVRIVYLKNKSFVPEVKEIYKNDPDLKVRKIALQYFCAIKEKSVIPDLIKKIKESKDEKEKKYSIQAIRIIVDSDEEQISKKDKDIYIEVIKALKDGLKDTSGKIRMESAYQLAKLGDISGYDAAVNDMKSSNPLVRERAIEVLGETGDQKALNLIETALKDKDVWVRTKAKIAKEKLDLVKAVMSDELGVMSKKISMRKMNQVTKNQKIQKLREILNSDKMLDIKIWAANEMLDMREEGILAADEMIKNNEKGAYVMGKEMAGRK